MPHTVVSVLTTETSYFETQPGPSAPLNFLKIASGAPRRTCTDFLTLSQFAFISFTACHAHLLALAVRPQLQADMQRRMLRSREQGHRFHTVQACSALASSGSTTPCGIVNEPQSAAMQWRIHMVT